MAKPAQDLERSASSQSDQLSAYIVGMDHVAITVRDMAKTSTFYRAVLGAELVREYEIDDVAVWRQFRIGGTMVNIHQEGHQLPLVAACPTPGSADLCFRWNAPIEEAVNRLTEVGTAIIEGPVQRVGSEGRAGLSVYFRDPDGNLLELLTTAHLPPE